MELSRLVRTEFVVATLVALKAAEIARIRVIRDLGEKGGFLWKI